MGFAQRRGVDNRRASISWLKEEKARGGSEQDRQGEVFMSRLQHSGRSSGCQPRPTA